MNNSNRTIRQMTFDNVLINILKTKENHKFSRYDAYLWLVENIVKGNDYSHGNRTCTMEHYCVTNTELADSWHWSRPTVQKFIDELINAGFIERRRYGNTFAFSLTSSSKRTIDV